MAKKQATIIEYMNRVIEAVPSGKVKTKEELVTLTDMLVLFMKKHNAFIVKDQTTVVSDVDAQREHRTYRLRLSTHSNTLFNSGRKENLAILKELFEIELVLTRVVNAGGLFNHKTECTVRHSDSSCFTNRTLSFSLTLVDSISQ